MEEWKTAGAFVQGTGHKKKKVPCQDRIYSIVDRGFAAISLADGAGSCSHSHIGAEIVTKTVVKVLEKKFDFLYGLSEKFIKDYILYELLVKLGYIACAFNVDLMELSSTLLFVAVKNRRYICGHIGDGVIGILNDENLNVLSHPERGEFANTTYFVTSHNALDHFKIMKGKIDSISGFVLMSDGSSESLYDRRERRLSIAINRMFCWMGDNEIQTVKVALYNNLKNVLRKYTLDDCSINLMKLAKTGGEVLDEGKQQFGFGFS